MLSKLRLRCLALAAVAMLASVAHAAGSYALKPGQTLAEVAADIYGSPYYRLVIERLNKLPENAKPAAGTSVRVPELKQMLLDEGLNKHAAGDIDDILKARYAYMRIRQDLIRALPPEGATAKMPVKLKAVLEESAAKIEAAARSLAKLGAHADSPTRMKNRLEGCAKAMRKLAAGKGDAKTEDSIHRLLAQAFVRGIMWARGEDGE